MIRLPAIGRSSQLKLGFITPLVRICNFFGPWAWTAAVKPLSNHSSSREALLPEERTTQEQKDLLQYVEENDPVAVLRASTKMVPFPVKMTTKILFTQEKSMNSNSEFLPLPSIPPPAPPAAPAAASPTSQHSPAERNPRSDMSKGGPQTNKELSTSSLHPSKLGNHPFLLGNPMFNRPEGDSRELRTANLGQLRGSFQPARYNISRLGLPQVTGPLPSPMTGPMLTLGKANFSCELISGEMSSVQFQNEMYLGMLLISTKYTTQQLQCRWHQNCTCSTSLTPH